MDTGNALSVGDCVMTFLAQTTELDEAFARIPAQADAAMSKAADSVSQVGDAAKQAGEELDATGDNAAYAGEKIAEGMETAKVSIRGVSEQARVAEEMIGVRLPRGVNRFLAELPGVQPAISAAFNVGIVFFLVEALANVSKKLSDFIANTFIYTQAMKDSEEAVKNQNKSLLQIAEAYDKAKEAADRFGKSRVELDKEKLHGIKDQIDADKKALTEAQAEVKRYAGILRELEAQEATANDTEITALMDQETAAQAAFDAAGARLTAAFENQKLHAAQQKQIQQQTDDAVVETHLEASKKTISIDESLGMSRIKIWASYAKYEAAFAKDAAEATLKVQREEAEREYQLKLQMLERMRAAEQSAAGGYKKAGDTDKENKEIQQVKETNAKIEALTAEHDAKLKQMAMETDAALLSLHANAAVMIEALTKRPLFPSLPQDTFNLLSMATAAERLGITLSTDLAKKAKEAQEAFALLDKEQKGGVISLRDLQSAQIKVMETQIQYDKEMGKAPVVVKAEEKALDDLKKKFDGLYPTEQKTRNFWDAFAADFKKKSHDVSEEASQMSGLMARAATQMDEAFASALMGALNSGKSIGAALEAATKQVLENLAEQALAHAIYCTAMGIAELALGVTDSSAGEWFAAAAEFGLVAGAVGAVGLAMPGGGGGGGGAAQMQGPSVGQTSSSTGGGGGSNQTTGVTHLAGGGIVTGPTRADIGENGEEAIIPLSDPEAMSRFAEAFTGLLSPSTLRAASGARAASSMMAASSMAPAPLDEQAMERVVSRAAGLNRNESLANVGGDTHVTHLHVKGLLDAGNLKKIIAKQNRMVQNRQVTVKSSDSLRITRRSQ